MSLAMAAVALPQAAKANVISFPGGISTTPGSSVFLNASGGHIDPTRQTNDQFELLTQVLGNPPTGPIIKARLTGLLGSFAVAASGGTLGGSSVALLKPGATVGPGLKFATQASTL